MTTSRLPMSSAGELFSSYDAGVGYDEMFDASGARAQYGPLFDELRAASAGELGLRQVEADKAFLHPSPFARPTARLDDFAREIVLGRGDDPLATARGISAELLSRAAT